MPIIITPVNDAPVLAPIGDLSIVKNTRSDPLLLSLADDATSAQMLNMTASSSNPGLIDNDGLLRSGSGTTRTLVVEPRPNQTGQSTITVRVTDSQGAASEQRFSVSVVEQPPDPPPAWLALLYFAGDDIEPSQPQGESLSEPLQNALARLQSMPYNPDVRLVALVDGNQPNDSQLLIREPSGWVVPPSPPPWLSPELDTGAVATLHNFLAWGRQQYPDAPHTFLALVDHGGGWAPDEGPSGQPRGRQMAAAGGWTGVSLDASSNKGVGSSLSTRETAQALAGLPKLDVLFFDACLMGLLESAYEVQPHVDYLVAGQSILWSQLPYERYLSPALLNASTTPDQFARQLVQNYNLGAPADEPYTLAAWELSGLAGDDGLAARLERLAAALLTTARRNPVPIDRALRKAYASAQKFDSDASYSQDATDAYVDLADFASRLATDTTLSVEMRLAATQVVEGVKASVLTRKTVEGVPRGGTSRWTFGGAHGVGLYAPLGERDCRPSGRPSQDVAQAAVPPCVAPGDAQVGDLQIEPQLPYYADPAQLRLTHDAPSWAELLTLLDAATPNRDPSRPGPYTPGQGEATFTIWMPALRH